MTTVISKGRYDDILFVAANMREEDKKEIYATRWKEDPALLAIDCIMGSTGFCWTIGKDEPIAAVGACPMWPGVWSAWMFATPRFSEVGLTTTKFIKKEMITILKPVSHRVQCHSWSEHKYAHKWLAVLGAKRESVLKKYGKNQERFFLFKWSK